MIITFATPEEALVWADFASRIAGGMHAQAAADGFGSTNEEIRQDAAEQADRFLQTWRERRGLRECGFCGQRTVRAEP